MKNNNNNISDNNDNNPNSFTVKSVLRYKSLKAIRPAVTRVYRHPDNGKVTHYNHEIYVVVHVDVSKGTVSVELDREHELYSTPQNLKYYRFDGVLPDWLQRIEDDKKNQKKNKNQLRQAEPLEDPREGEDEGEYREIIFNCIDTDHEAGSQPSTCENCKNYLEKLEESKKEISALMKDINKVNERNLKRKLKREREREQQHQEKQRTKTTITKIPVQAKITAFGVIE